MNFMLSSKRQVITSVDEDAEKLRPSYTADGNVKGTGALKTFWQFLKRLSTKLPRDLAIPLLVQKNHILHDSIYMKCPKYANS